MIGTRIELRKLSPTKNKILMGSAAGREAFTNLREFVESNGRCVLFEVSLEGITNLDSSFARESLVSLAKMFRGERGFVFTHPASPDLIDNLDYIAERKDQPLIVEITDGRYELIGPKLGAELKKVFDYAMEQGTVTTAKVTSKFDLSTQNASQKLKKLLQMGLLLGSKETAESGGLEYVYQAIRRI